MPSLFLFVSIMRRVININKYTLNYHLPRDPGLPHWDGETTAVSPGGLSSPGAAR